jgi:hypothetical protein
VRVCVRHGSENMEMQYMSHSTYVHMDVWM